MSQLPNLDVHDRPNAPTIAAGAFCIQWLQDILDYYYHMCPFSATIATATTVIPVTQDWYLLPADFILDVRNGALVQTIANDPLSSKRAVQVPLPNIPNRPSSTQTATNVLYPSYYCIFGDDCVTTTRQQLIHFTPDPTVAVSTIWYYYQLPPILAANDKPKFPNDYVCIEYVRIRALEWARVYDPGTAQRFAEKVVAGMKAAGLMNEPEDDEIPFDELTFRKRTSQALLSQKTYAWMGP